MSWLLEPYQRNPAKRPRGEALSRKGSCVSANKAANASILRQEFRSFLGQGIDKTFGHSEHLSHFQQLEWQQAPNLAKIKYPVKNNYLTEYDAFRAQMLMEEGETVKRIKKEVMWKALIADRDQMNELLGKLAASLE